MIDIDKLFKIGILVFGVLFLILYYQESRNGRYVNNEKIVFDTATGKMYALPSFNEVSFVDPVGKIYQTYRLKNPDFD